MAAPEPASALPAVAEPVPPARAEPVVATVATDVVEAGPAPSNPVAARPVAAESSRRSEAPRVLDGLRPRAGSTTGSRAADAGPQRCSGGSSSGCSACGCSARPRCATPSRRRRAPMPPPNRAWRRQQRLRRRRSPIGSHAHSTWWSAPADPHDAIRPAPASVRESAAGGDGRPPLRVAPARRGGGRGWAHGRGRPEGCAYH